MNECLIGLDLGTSSVKGVLMAADGVVLSRQKAATRYVSPRENFVEFDAEEFFELAAEVIRNLASTLPAGYYVAGICLSSASGNTVLTDTAGKPLIPAVSWMDKRVADETETVLGSLDADFVHELTGWPYLHIFPLAHLCWLKCHRPEILEQAAMVCMSADFVNFRLTGKWGVDRSTATTSCLLDQKAGTWHLPFLQKLGIPAGKLPPLYDSGTKLGEITPHAAEITGLPARTPVVLGSFDHPSAARGAGVLEEGQLLLSCGTSWVGFYPLKDRSLIIRQKLLADPFLPEQGLWGAMFSLTEISTFTDRIIDRYISDSPERYKVFDTLAESAQIGADGLLVNPMRDDDLTGQTKAGIARAVMEGTVFLLKFKIEKLKAAGIKADSAAMVGGPSDSRPWPQIVADVLGMEITVVNSSCAGAVGAAVLAGIGAGVYGDLKDACQKIAFEKTVLVPDKAAHETYNRLYGEFIGKFPDAGGVGV